MINNMCEPSKDEDKLLLMAVGLFSIVVMAFSPVLCYLISVIVLLWFGDKESGRQLRLFFVPIALISLLIIYYSRDFKAELEHDLGVYYAEYLKMAVGSWSEYNLFANGLEPGYHALYSPIAKLAPEIKPVSLAFINVIVVLTLLIIWAEIYLFKERAVYKDAGLVYALIIMFVGFVTFGYLQRQSLSVVFLLYSLTSKKRSSFLVFSGLSVCFHLSSLPLIVFYKLIQRSNISLKVLLLTIPFIVIVMALVRYNFYGLIDFALSRNIEFPGSHKLAFYKNEGFMILSMKDFIINLILFVSLLMIWERVDKSWRNIIFLSLFLYFSFIGIPLLAERINFILFFLYGFFMYLVFFKGKSNRSICKLGFSVYLFLFCFKNVSMTEMPDYEYWYRFSYFDFMPFYYFFN